MVKKWIPPDKYVYRCEILNHECGDVCYLPEERPNCKDCRVYLDWKEKHSHENHATQKLGSEDKPSKGQAMGFLPSVWVKGKRAEEGES